MKQKFKELKVNDRVKTLHSGMATVVAVGYNAGIMVKLDCDVKKWNCPYFYEHELDFGEEDIDEQDIDEQDMEQTAVEWLSNELYEKFEMKGDGALFNDLVNQAKEMEKQQIENAFNNGYYQETIGYNASEQYYNETFKKK